ncbi:MAG: hypothetical protein JSU06_00425 [Actinobacteria bacterium]|nr:hypothetical protein [Actinomycetota bacterium]
MSDQGPTREAVVYVPTGEHPATSAIVAGSGIVGRPDGSSLTEIYFEGAIFGQVNMTSFADRVAHAYDRMATDYPTTAKMVVPRDALVVVGIYFPRDGRVELTGPTSEAQVAGWLVGGDRPLDPTELVCRRGPS